METPLPNETKPDEETEESTTQAEPEAVAESTDLPIDDSMKKVEVEYVDADAEPETVAEAETSATVTEAKTQVEQATQPTSDSEAEQVASYSAVPRGAVAFTFALLAFYIIYYTISYFEIFVLRGA